MSKEIEGTSRKISRREFLKMAGNFFVCSGVASVVGGCRLSPSASARVANENLGNIKERVGNSDFDTGVPVETSRQGELINFVGFEQRSYGDGLYVDRYSFEARGTVPANSDWIDWILVDLLEIKDIHTDPESPAFAIYPFQSEEIRKTEKVVLKFRRIQPSVNGRYRVSEAFVYRFSEDGGVVERIIPQEVRNFPPLDNFRSAVLEWEGSSVREILR